MTGSFLSFDIFSAVFVLWHDLYRVAARVQLWLGFGLFVAAGDILGEVVVRVRALLVRMLTLALLGVSFLFWLEMVFMWPMAELEVRGP